MTLVTGEEREQGIKEFEDKGILLETPDLEYFKQRLARMEARGATEEATLKIRKQIELLEDAIIIYHEHRPAG